MPVKPDRRAQAEMKDIYNAELKMLIKEKVECKSGLKKMFQAVNGVCSIALLQLLESLAGYDNMCDTGDTIALLIEIKKIMYQTGDNLHPLHALNKALTVLFNCYQKEKTLADYKIVFDSAVQLCEDLGANLEALQGCIYGQAIMTKKVDRSVKVEDIDDEFSSATKVCILAEHGKEQLFAMMYILRANRQQYGYLQQSILNDTNKDSIWPTTRTVAHRKLLTWRSPENTQSRQRQYQQQDKQDHDDQHTQPNNESPAATTGDVQMLFNIEGQPICFKRKQVGHIKPDCPYKDKSKEELRQIFPTTVFSTIGSGQTTFLPSEQELESPASTGVDSSGITGVGSSSESENTNLGPIGMRAMTSDEAAAFLQTVQDEYDSDESAARASLLSVTINEQNATTNKNEEEENQRNNNMGNKDHALAQSQRAVDDWWILLDNESTVDIFCNRASVQDIREVEHGCRIVTAAGSKTTNLIATLPGYNRPVWFDPDGIANILSLNNVRTYLRVTYDSWPGHPDSNCFVVHLPENRICIFQMLPQGLYYVNMRRQATVLTLTSQQETTNDMEGVNNNTTGEDTNNSNQNGNTNTENNESSNSHRTHENI